MGLGNWLKVALGAGAKEAIPNADVAAATAALERFCEHHPAHHRDRLWYSYRMEVDRVTLVEERPFFKNPEQVTQTAVAMFEYSDDGRWSLWWPDRNGKWHRYEQFEAASFEQALQEVSDDPTNIFFG